MFSMLQMPQVTHSGPLQTPAALGSPLFPWLSLMWPLPFGTVLWRNTWLCLPQRSGGKSQRGLTSGGTFLSAVEHWMSNMLLSKPLLNQDPSSTITREHTRWLSEYCLWVIDVGGYGRTSNGSILANSAFGQALWSLTLKLPADLLLPGADHRGPQPHVFVADEAFPLRKNLIRPFPGGILPRERRAFNYCLSQARLVVENAFGILSSQWRLYRCAIEVHPEVAENCEGCLCSP